jgi:hypothetical protein
VTAGPDKSHPEAGFIEVEPLLIVGIDLVWVLLGAMVMLTFGAGWIIFAVIGRVLSEVLPNPFGLLGDLFTWISGKWYGALKWAWTSVEKHCAHMAHTMWSFVSSLWRSLYVILTVLQWLWGWVDGTNQAIGRMQDQLQAKEAADYRQLQGQEAADYHQLAVTEAANLAAEQNAIATLGLNVLAIEGRLQAQEHTDVHNLQANLNTVDNQLHQLLQSDVLNLNNRITSVQTVLAGQEHTDVHNLQANLNAVDNSIPGVALGVVAGAAPGIVAQAVAQVAPQLQKINTDLTECLDPLCNTVTPNASRLGHLGNLLKGLEALGLEALFVALAAEMLTHPAAVIEDFQSVMGAVGDPIMTGFRDLTGG